MLCAFKNQNLVSYENRLQQTIRALYIPSLWIYHNRFIVSLLDLRYQTKTNSSHIVKQPRFAAADTFSAKSIFSLLVSPISMGTGTEKYFCQN